MPKTTYEEKQVMEEQGLEGMSIDICRQDEDFNESVQARMEYHSEVQPLALARKPEKRVRLD